MNVLLLNASPRPAGIVSQALDAAASTARQAGAETVKAELYRAPIAPCTGCMRCRATGVCPLPHDAAHELGEAIRRADLLVVGTPTYWGGMAARLKLLFERLVPVFMGESPRGIPQPRLKGRQAVVIAACTTPCPSICSSARAGAPCAACAKCSRREACASARSRSQAPKHSTVICPKPPDAKSNGS